MYPYVNGAMLEELYLRKGVSVFTRHTEEKLTIWNAFRKHTKVKVWLSSWWFGKS